MGREREREFKNINEFVKQNRLKKEKKDWCIWEEREREMGYFLVTLVWALRREFF